MNQLTKWDMELMHSIKNALKHQLNRPAMASELERIITTLEENDSEFAAAIAMLVIVLMATFNG
jgi:hypothetical protein